VNFGKFNSDAFKLNAEVFELIPQIAKSFGIFGCFVSRLPAILALVGDVLGGKISPTKYVILTSENFLRSLIASA